MAATGRFGTASNAESFRQRMLSLAASNDVEGRLDVVNRDGLYKVRIGPFSTMARARDVADFERANRGDALSVLPLSHKNPHLNQVAGFLWLPGGFVSALGVA